MSNQLTSFDDDGGELDLASAEHLDAGGGPTGFAGELSGANGSGRSINTTAVVLGIIVAATAVGILSMRWVSAASATAIIGGGPDLIAMLPESGDDLDPAKQEAVMAGLRDDATAKQVPSEYVQRDPFWIPGVDVEDGDGGKTVDPPPVKTEEELREERRQMIEAAANQVVVTSMLTGANPVARLGDVPVRIGDEVTVDDWMFTVESIDPIGVTLVLEDALLRGPVRVLRKPGEGADVPPTRSSSRGRPGRRR